MSEINKSLVAAWEESKNVLDAAKAKEMELRKQVLSEVYNFSDDELREGTENLELGNGFKLKAVFKTTMTLNNKEDGVDKALEKIEKTGAEGVVLAERLVRWKPELSVTEYKKLPDKFRKIIDAVVVTKPATPSLEIVAPKGGV